MGKAVKKIATVAAIGAAAFYGGGALAASLSGGAAATTAAAGVGHLGAAGAATFYGGATAAAGTGAGIFGSSLVSKVGLGLQGVSYLQQRKYASAQARATKQAAEEQMRINRMQERVRLVQERRQRLDLLRQQRIQTAQIETEAGSGGMSLQGTSGVLGSTGAIQTQTTANLSAINMASGASTAISRASQTAADFQTRANLASGQQTMYSNLGTLGQNIISQKNEIGNIFKIG